MKKIHPKRLWRGDILICRPQTYDMLAERISKDSDSPYTHAAIYLGAGEIAESRPGKGVSITTLRALIERYAHIAVVRHPDAFTHHRPARLRAFVQELITQRAGYSYLGAGRLRSQRRKRDEDLMDRIRSFFSRGKTLRWRSRSYFCSQLVVACLIDSGFIDESAVAIYPPNAFYPGNFFHDPTFGFLVGFLAKSASYQPPADDPLHMLASVEIF